MYDLINSDWTFLNFFVFRMSDSFLRQIANLNVNDRVEIQPENVSNSDLQRLADVGHVVGMQSYLNLKKRCDDLGKKNEDLQTDLSVHRLSYLAISDRCQSLEKVLKSSRKTFDALRRLEGRVQALDRDLSKYMLDLHDVHDQSHDPQILYDFTWSVINTIQADVEQMNDGYFLEILEGFEKIDNQGRLINITYFVY